MNYPEEGNLKSIIDFLKKGSNWYNGRRPSSLGELLSEVSFSDEMLSYRVTYMSKSVLHGWGHNSRYEYIFEFEFDNPKIAKRVYERIKETLGDSFRDVALFSFRVYTKGNKIIIKS